MSVPDGVVPRQNVPGNFQFSAPVSVPQTGNVPARLFLNKDSFVSMLYLERRRAERTQNRFVLVLIDVSSVNPEAQNVRMVKKIAEGLSDSIRETDVTGWYVENSLIGIIGTDLGGASSQLIRERFLEKLRRVFHKAVGEDKARSIFASFHFFPEEVEKNDEGHSVDETLYPELARREERKRVSIALKRAIDVVGSSLALGLLAPVFTGIAAAIKMTSKGPVLFRQERLGLHGKKFRVLKFRSMRTDCDSKIHEAYVNQFITDKVDCNTAAGSDKPLYKLRTDPRITKVGHFLRKTSLDELPQFWNVLVGDMSLVGPRPPVEYEYQAYNIWHRRRVLEVKPGITGLWQVKGRSRIRFDDMVRLDLQYARTWSIWLDLKILAQTPSAVLAGEGAH